MEITVRGLWTLIHGMGFGALYLLACSGALVESRLWQLLIHDVGDEQRHRLDELLVPVEGSRQSRFDQLRKPPRRRSVAPTKRDHGRHRRGL
jgi:hypothetical protein